MKHLKYSCLVFRSLYQLVRYDVIQALRGSANIDRRLSRQPLTPEPTSQELVQAACDAVVLATSLYWKPVLCLQRSVCIVRLLRKQGVVARLVIGFSPAPFVSHAWVEVDGRIVNDSPVYQERLQVLYTA